MFKSYLFSILAALILLACNSNPNTVEDFAYTNALVNETSPYLLQHAHNPVDWYAWNDSTLAKAKRENKLMLISVGYAACHWCHVMERESFEDTAVAAVMNANFINIKVDREERPDVDQIYMNAIQLMKGRGGWPLNVIALPDGRPVWAETYVPKDEWKRALSQIQTLYEDSPERLVDYAARLEAGIKSLDLVEINRNEVDFSALKTDSIVAAWSNRFDDKDGGIAQAPKFMMPNNYHFLLRYAVETKNKDLLDFVQLTLKKMAFGGVYDHVGGGFARYSTDMRWHIPHFEKMLYDNGQLVSLYSDAYLVDPNPLYKEVVYETLNYINEEMTHESGAFYSSLDADSKSPDGELKEGAYYVYTEAEIDSLITDRPELFKSYYNINDYGKWEEEGAYVLIRQETDEQFTAANNLSQAQLNGLKSLWKQKLGVYRNTRPRPGLDDKSLTSWNGLMLKGYLDAYRVFNEPQFLEAATNNANFLKDKQLKADGGLWHSYKDGKSTINGYLEDYATVIDGFIAMYETTFDEQWLNLAKSLLEYAQEHFGYTDSRLFYFTSDQDAQLVSRSIEYRDNVIPASNSIMAHNLLKLGHYFDQPDWIKDAQTMLHNVLPEVAAYPTSFSNWMQLGRNFQNEFYELVVVGPQAEEVLAEINKTYIPNKMIAASTTESDAPLLKNRFIEGETFVYVCVNNTCKLPVRTAAEALPLMGY